MNVRVDSKKIILITIGIVALLVGIFGATYAFFFAEVNNPDGSSMDITTANLGKVVFTDGPEINLNDVYPGTTVVKEFTIERTEATVNDEVFYNINLIVTENTLTAVAEGEFMYAIYCEEQTGSGNVVEELYGKPVPETTTTLGTGSFIGNGVQTYLFYVSLGETGSNQNSTRGMGFTGYLQVGLSEDSGTSVEDCYLIYQGSIYDYLDYEAGDPNNPACSRDMEIPATINGETPTSIFQYAFYQKGLTSVTIPGSITTIGAGAFTDNSITSVTMGEGITTIEAYAFSQNSITTITIPGTVSTIGQYAFLNNSITSLTIPAGITTVEGGSFAINSISSLSLPETLTTIGSMAFYQNQLTSVTIPSSVNSIEDAAFYENYLTSVCIKGKSNSSGFTTYGSGIWTWAGWSDSYITWNCTN